MTRLLLRLIGVMPCIVAMLLATTGMGGQVPTPAVRLDPITAIVAAFQTYRLVALGEGSHGNEQAHQFRLSLIRDPRFAEVVNDIVVESGNAQYQSLMDRFIAGEDVPSEQLRHAWQDTTQPTAIWDLPIYEEFLRAVREVNASLPRDRRLRVLLGDPPVDWSTVQSLADLNKFGNRDAHAITVIRRDVLDRNRRALVIYGDDHFARKSRALTGDDWATNIVGQLAKANIASAFVIHTETRMDLASMQPDIATWPKPSLALLRGTTIGATDFEPSPRLRPRRTEELFDAVLYVGPPTEITFARLSPQLCADINYTQMRLQRLQLLPGPPPQAPPGTAGPLEQFRQQCASVLPR